MFYLYVQAMENIYENRGLPFLGTNMGDLNVDKQEIQPLNGDSCCGQRVSKFSAGAYTPSF